MLIKISSHQGMACLKSGRGIATPEKYIVASARCSENMHVQSLRRGHLFLIIPHRREHTRALVCAGSPPSLQRLNRASSHDIVLPHSQRVRASSKPPNLLDQLLHAGPDLAVQTHVDGFPQPAHRNTRDANVTPRRTRSDLSSCDPVSQRFFLFPAYTAWGAVGG